MAEVHRMPGLGGNLRRSPGNLRRCLHHTGAEPIPIAAVSENRLDGAEEYGGPHHHASDG